MMTARILAAIVCSVPLASAFTAASLCVGRASPWAPLIASPRIARRIGLEMALKPADTVPKDLKLAINGEDGPTMKTAEEIFGGKRCVVFGVPGAFYNEECLKMFLEKHQDLKNAGAELVACVSVNDPYVMAEWANARQVGDKMLMLADVSGNFTDTMGYLSGDTELLGKRAKGYAVVLDQSMVCEYMASDKPDLPATILGHLTFLKGTGFLEEVPSKAVALASKVNMESGAMQQMMAAAYDKARLETQEISRVKNDFVAKLEMAGRQATIRLKTMGEIGLATFRADEASKNATKADSLPDEVFLRTAPMNLAKRNAIEQNRKQWGIGYDPMNPQRVSTGLKAEDT